ncbi:uncharacterized protein TRIADDRAFT_55889 [Trichoplax adhaerens]|uniref:Uncharacterized protein n=1 Tax=Trichoplax adhaerens TaxID=10228 RepID=B3RW55_TRIAD|nr:predicted protein [Trichoplax adhaerens]EDV26119.1 predicted protein [Trichoplax adhaerens]|eukprot:XP_002112152.1 predicted protein [Trichoplax adhaerens]
MSEKTDKNFLSTIGWNPIKIRKSSQTSNNNSNVGDTKLFELEKSTESIDTVGSENSEDNPESKKPSFLARQLQKLKFRGKSGQSATASDEKVNSQGTNIDATEKDEVKSNTIGLHIDSPDLNDGDRTFALFTR